MTTKDLVSYDEMLAKMAKKGAQLEKPQGSSIGTRAGILKYGGNPVPNNKLDAIIVSSMFSHLYYEGLFDEANPANPVCFAYSEDGENMAPHPASSKPQSDTCATCPMAKWGSDPKGGRGKACKEVRTLGLVPADTKAVDAPLAEVATLKLPVMSVKNWANYIYKCDALYQKPPIAMLTQIGTVPDLKSQFRITFTDIGKASPEVVMALIPRIDSVNALLTHVYEPNPEPGEQAEKKSSKY